MSSSIAQDQHLNPSTVMKVLFLLSCFYWSNLAWGVKVNPLPVINDIVWGEGNELEVSQSLSLEAKNTTEVLEKAFKRFKHTVFNTKWYPAAVEKPIASYESFPSGVVKKRANDGPDLNSLQLTVTDTQSDLQLNVDESYEIDISEGSNEIKINAETVWGALHAFTTLQQLIIYEKKKGFYIEKPVKIKDSPKYPHRGLMLDTGRNFLIVKKILEQIDIMAISKMNVLHWHLADSQSWPIELEAYPEMTKDAFSERETYSEKHIKSVVEYARDRGVRVVPEIDMPGHARAGWRQANSEIVTCGDSWWSNDNFDKHTAFEPPPGQLDIMNNDTYDVVEEVYDELSSLFADDVFHVGADELQVGCYNFSSKVQNWFSANPTKTFKDLTQYWLDKTLPIFNNTDTRKLTMWADIVTTEEGARKVPKDIILQSWSDDKEELKKITSKGYDVIVSNQDFLYLDCGHGGWITNDPRYIDISSNSDFNKNAGGSSCGPYKTWQRIFDYDFTHNLTSEESKHVLGAEACMWSEQVDSVVLTQKIWPRTAALAESTWSGNRDPKTGYLRTNYLSQRIFNFREYLVALGYPASPLVSKFCWKNPHACDFYRNQTYLNQY